MSFFTTIFSGASIFWIVPSLTTTTMKTLVWKFKFKLWSLICTTTCIMLVFVVLGSGFSGVVQNTYQENMSIDIIKYLDNQVYAYNFDVASL